MNDPKSLTYLNLTPAAKRLAKMAAARSGISLSEYVEHLIGEDAQRTGLADLVGAAKGVSDVE